MVTEKFQTSELHQIKLLTIQEVADWQKFIKRLFTDGSQIIKFLLFDLGIGPIVFQKKQ